MEVRSNAVKTGIRDHKQSGGGRHIEPSVRSIILESFKGIAESYAAVFKVFEYVSVAVFTLEYLLRIWTADLLYPEAKHPRLKYMRSFMAIVDLAAILPFFIPFISIDLRFLRMIRLLRLLRLLRILKLGRYFDALTIVVKVIKKSASQLVISIIICFFVMLFSAIIMYTVENPVQPEAFPNVISALWWAICTLTTVGYGDVYPITHTGRLFALPTGILAAGFSSVINERAENADGKTDEDAKRYCPYCGHKLDE